MLKVLNRRAWVTGKVRGITPNEAIDQMIR
jgi:hypothetical protein